MEGDAKTPPGSSRFNQALVVQKINLKSRLSPASAGLFRGRALNQPPATPLMQWDCRPTPSESPAQPLMDTCWLASPPSPRGCPLLGLTGRIAAGHGPVAIVLVSELNRVIDTSVVINDASSGG